LYTCNYILEQQIPIYKSFLLKWIKNLKSLPKDKDKFINWLENSANVYNHHLKIQVWKRYKTEVLNLPNRPKEVNNDRQYTYTTNINNIEEFHI